MVIEELIKLTHHSASTPRVDVRSWNLGAATDPRAPFPVSVGWLSVEFGREDRTSI